MVKNSKTPYHSVGTISFDPKDPPAPGTTISPKPISTESIFTGTQVFAKTPNGQWKDIHAVISDLQQRVADSVESFTDCRRAPDEMIDGKRFVVYIGSQDSGALNIATKIWVSVETGTLAPLRYYDYGTYASGRQDQASIDVVALRLCRHQTPGVIELVDRAASYRGHYFPACTEKIDQRAGK